MIVADNGAFRSFTSDHRNLVIQPDFLQSIRNDELAILPQGVLERNGKVVVKRHNELSGSLVQVLKLFKERVAFVLADKSNLDFLNSWTEVIGNECKRVGEGRLNLVIADIAPIVDVGDGSDGMADFVLVLPTSKQQIMFVHLDN